MVMDLKFKGFMAPVFTPFSRSTGELNLGNTSEYAQYLVQNGVQGVLVNGTVGEGVCMSVSERKTVLEAWMEAAHGLQTPLHVMVHIGGVSLRDVQELAMHAESVAVNSILCLPDLFHRPSNVSELVHYLSLVGEAAPSTPLLYYHYPAATGINLDMAQLLKEAGLKIPRLAGIKFTHNNLKEGSDCLRVNGGQFSVLLGCDQLIAAGFLCGFDSLIATTLNMFAPLIGEIKNGLENNKVSEVQAKQQMLLNIIEAIEKYGKWVPAMKEAMHIITGFDFGIAREPQGILTSDKINHLRADLTSLNLVTR